MTPTYLKPRDVSDSHLGGEHERYDTKNRAPTPANVRVQVLDSLDAILPEVDALIVADQVEGDDHGIITADLRGELAQRARVFSDTVFWADSRAHIRQFRHVIIKPNQFEAVGHDQPQPGEVVGLDPLKLAATRLRTEVGAPVCVTRGAEGMLVVDTEVTLVPGVRLQGPVDPTGAGDSVTAAATLALASGASLPEAALLGVLTSSITAEQLATTGSATPAQVLERLQMWREQNQEK